MKEITAKTIPAELINIGKYVFMPFAIFMIGLFFIEASISSQAVNAFFDFLSKNCQESSPGMYLMVQKAAYQAIAFHLMYFFCCVMSLAVAIKYIWLYCANKKTVVAICIVLTLLSFLGIFGISHIKPLYLDDIFFNIVQKTLESVPYEQLNFFGLRFSTMLFLLALLLGQGVIWFCIVAGACLSKTIGADSKTVDLRTLLYAGSITLATGMLALNSWFQWPCYILREVSDQEICSSLGSMLCFIYAVIFCMIIVSSYIHVALSLKVPLYGKKADDTISKKMPKDRGMHPASPSRIFIDIFAILSPVVSSILGSYIT